MFFIASVNIITVTCVFAGNNFSQKWLKGFWVTSHQGLGYLLLLNVSCWICFNTEVFWFFFSPLLVTFTFWCTWVSLSKASAFLTKEPPANRWLFFPFLTNLLILCIFIFWMKLHHGPSALVFRVVPLCLCDISFSFIDDISLLHIASDFTQNPAPLHNENITWNWSGDEFWSSSSDDPGLIVLLLVKTVGDFLMINFLCPLQFFWSTSFCLDAWLCGITANILVQFKKTLMLFTTKQDETAYLDAFCKENITIRYHNFLDSGHFLDLCTAINLWVLFQPLMWSTPV